MENDEFRTVVRQSEGSYSELRSKFLAFAYPVNSVDAAMEIVAYMKRKYYDARHVAYAYMIGVSDALFRANDDGEPSGTAGKPILGQIRSNELTDVLVVVVRYFGGVKLGTSRLAEAYRAAAAEALKNNEFVIKQITAELSFRFNYERMNGVMRVLRDIDARIIENTYDEGCKMKVSVRISKQDDLRERLLKVETVEICK